MRIPRQPLVFWASVSHTYLKLQLPSPCRRRDGVYAFSAGEAFEATRGRVEPLARRPVGSVFRHSNRRHLLVGVEKVPLRVCDLWESLFHAQHRLNPSHESGPPICPLRQLKLLPVVYRCGLGSGEDKGLVWATSGSNWRVEPRSLSRTLRASGLPTSRSQSPPWREVKSTPPSFFLSCHVEWPA